MAKAYIGIGSNLGDRAATIQAALGLLAEEDGVEVTAVSSLRETEPVGVVDQPMFLNGAARLETTLTPRELLDRLLSIEEQLGRVRTAERYGPRAIDLDLLAYDAEVLDEPGLRIPHPRLHERRFVLEPLAELAPDLEIPGRGWVQELFAGLQ